MKQPGGKDFGAVSFFFFQPNKDQRAEFTLFNFYVL